MLTDFVSVVIPCLNEERFIAQCLTSILEGDFPHEQMEILVVDGGSTDRTIEIIDDFVARFPFIRRLSNPREITPAALNIGIAEARGDYIARMDAHAEYEPDYLSACLAASKKHGVEIVGGVLRTVAREQGPFARAVEIALSHPLGVGNSYFRLGTRDIRQVDVAGFGFYRKEVFERVGLFNELLARSQDIDFSMRVRRAGGSIVLDPSIRGTYYSISKISELFSYSFWNGLWVTYPIRIARTRFSTRHFVPLLFVLTLVVGGILGAFVPRLIPLPVAVLGFYLVLTVAAGIIRARTERAPGLSLRLPMAFWALHFGYGLGTIYGLFGRPKAQGARATT